MSRCGNCGAEVSGSHKFCLSCGREVMPAAAGGGRCGQCGTDLPAGAQFCLRCGQPVAGAAVPLGVPQAVPGTPFGAPPGTGFPAPGFPPPGFPPPGFPPPRKRRTGVILFSILFPVLLLGGIGVVLFMVLGRGCSKAEGTITAEGDPLGDFVMKPNRCQSGQHQGFRGVILSSDVSSQGVQVVEDPVRGTVVQVRIPGSCNGTGCEMLRLEADDCDLFDFQLRNTNTTVNNIRLVEGHLRLDCAFDEGGSLEANVTFTCD